jgi:O-antigen/teichoic acid export membrane protein
MPLRLIKQIRDSKHLTKYLYNTSWLLIDYGLRQVGTLLIGIYMYRYLQPERLGILSYCTGLVILFMPLATLGINSILVRELVNKPENKNVLLGSSFMLKLICSLAAILLVFLAIQITGDGWLNSLMIMIIASGFIFQAVNIIDPYFQSKVASKNVVFAQQASFIISIAIKIALIYYNQPLIYFAVATLLETVLFSLGLMVVYRANGFKMLQWQWDGVTMRKLFRHSLPMLLSGVFVTIYMKIDTLMITWMVDKDANKNYFDAGNYTAAVRLTEAFYGIGVTLAGSLFPAVVNGLKISMEEFHKRLQRLFDLFTWMAIGVSVIISFFSQEITYLLYGKDYAESAPVLALMIWASVFVFQGVASSQALVAENKQKYITLYTVIGCIINIILNWFLIPAYGIKGAAYATLIAYFFSAYFNNILFKETRYIFVQLTDSLLLKRPIRIFKERLNARKNNP